jgi:hypothetical protein
MTTLIQAITVLLMGFIMREAPNVREGKPLYDEFQTSIGTLVSTHAGISTGLLVDPHFDILLLSAVNYRESRMRLPAPEGDCRWGHKLDNIPSGSWPAGYKPKSMRICNAVGPMQLNRGAGYQTLSWAETNDMFSTKGVRDLQDVETNVRLAYAILVHWKNVCRDRDGSEAPMGVWLTAYRRGSCPTVGKTRRYYVDREAKIRCKMANDMAKDLQGNDGVAYAGPIEVPCTYADETKPKE